MADKDGEPQETPAERAQRIYDEAVAKDKERQLKDKKARGGSGEGSEDADR